MFHTVAAHVNTDSSSEKGIVYNRTGFLLSNLFLANT